MPQFLRPDSDVTTAGVTGGFADIDEAVRSDVDFAYGTSGSTNTLEVGLSNPASGTLQAGTCTVRFTWVQANSGASPAAPATIGVGWGTTECRLYQGATQVATSGAQTNTGAWQQGSFTFSQGSITDWSDLRLRFVFAGAGGGAPANRRSCATSWAEVEIPDVAPPSPGTAPAAAVSAIGAVASPAATGAAVAPAASASAAAGVGIGAVAPAASTSATAATATGSPTGAAVAPTGTSDATGSVSAGSMFPLREPDRAPVLWTSRFEPPESLCRLDDWWLQRGTRILRVFDSSVRRFVEYRDVGGQRQPMLELVAAGSPIPVESSVPGGYVAGDYWLTGYAQFDGL